MKTRPDEIKRRLKSAGGFSKLIKVVAGKFPEQSKRGHAGRDEISA